MVLIPGSGGEKLAETLGKSLRIPVAAVQRCRFNDGAWDVALSPAANGPVAWLVQPLAGPIHDHFIELCFLADAAQHAGYGAVKALIPYFAYARADKAAEPGRARPLAILGRLLRGAGIDEVMVCDPHTEDFPTRLGLPVTVVNALEGLAQAKVATFPENAEVVLVAPDHGACPRVQRMARHLGLPWAHVDKTRLAPGEVRSGAVHGEVKGKTCLLLDDMIDTGGTLCAAAETLQQAGAAEIHALATHGLFNEPAAERFAQSRLASLTVSDSLPKAYEKAEILPLAPVLAEALNEKLNSEETATRDAVVVSLR